MHLVRQSDYRRRLCRILEFEAWDVQIVESQGSTVKLGKSISSKIRSYNKFMVHLDDMRFSRDIPNIWINGTSEEYHYDEIRRMQSAEPQGWGEGVVGETDPLEGYNPRPNGTDSTSTQ